MFWEVFAQVNSRGHPAPLPPPHPIHNRVRGSRVNPLPSDTVSAPPLGVGGGGVPLSSDDLVYTSPQDSSSLFQVSLTSLLSSKMP